MAITDSERGRAVLITALLLAFQVLLGCQAQQTTPGQPAAATAPVAAPETLRVGIALPISGPTARPALMTERIYRLAMDDINAQGGVTAGGKTYRLEAVTADEKFTSEGGREAANRLVLAEKVRMIFGPGSSSSTAGAQAVTEPNKVLILPAAAADASLGPKFPFTVAGGSPHQRMRAPAIYNWLVKTHPQAKRIAIAGTDDATGRNYGVIAEELAKERSLTVVANEYYPLDLKDFNPLVTRMLLQKPDAIDIGNTGASIAFFNAFAKALYEQGYRQPVIANYGTGALLQAGPAAEGVVFQALVDYKVPTVPDRVKDVIQRFIQKYGEAETDAAAVVNYSVPLVLAQALQKAGTVDDTEKIAKTLREGEWDTIFGKARYSGAKTFGLPSYLEVPTYLSKVEGGKIVTIDVTLGSLP